MFSDPGFACYAMHKQAIEDFIDVLVDAKDPNNLVTQYEASLAVGLDLKAVTDNEAAYIEQTVGRRRWSKYS